MSSTSVGDFTNRITTIHRCTNPFPVWEKKRTWLEGDSLKLFEKVSLQKGPLNPKTVGELLKDKMSANGWGGVERWVRQSDDIAPTIVGGSKKHGGPDLGPTRAEKAWATLGVDGIGIAYEAPLKDFVGMPRLTVEMVARIQGFPDDWHFTGKNPQHIGKLGMLFRHLSLMQWEPISSMR